MTYYESLGVSKTATTAEIKAAYRKLAFDNHPDRNPDNAEAEARFKTATEAYQVLSNDDRRRAYDTTGRSAFSDQNDWSDPRNMEQEIYNFMQQSQGGHPFFAQESFRRRGSQFAHVASIKVTLEDILLGKTTDIKIEQPLPCDTCVGTTFDTTKPGPDCDACGGSGQKTKNLGNMLFAMTCNVCGGARKKFPPCPTCSGSGTTMFSKTTSLTIPPGIRPDNHIQILVDNKKFYVLIESDIPDTIKLDVDGNVYERIHVPYADLVLGGKYNASLIGSEKVTVKVPSGTIIGQGLKIAKHGIPKTPNSPDRGDYVLVVDLEVPTTVSDEERELLQKLKDLKKQ